jgi:hypothetical protein
MALGCLHCVQLPQWHLEKSQNGPEATVADRADTPVRSLPPRITAPATLQHADFALLSASQLDNWAWTCPKQPVGRPPTSAVVALMIPVQSRHSTADTKMAGKP